MFMFSTPKTPLCHSLRSTVTRYQQAAVLRQYVADCIRQRDSLVEAALNFIVSRAGGESIASNGGDVCDSKMVQELLDWWERLKGESKDLDPTEATVKGETTYTTCKCIENYQSTLESAHLLFDFTIHPEH